MHLLLLAACTGASVILTTYVPGGLGWIEKVLVYSLQAGAPVVIGGDRGDGGIHSLAVTAGKLRVVRAR